MIRLERFCPVERIAQCLRVKLRERGVKFTECQLRGEGLDVRFRPIDDENLAAQLGDTTDEVLDHRLRIATASELNFVLDIFDGERVMHTREVRVSHVLRCADLRSSKTDGNGMMLAGNLTYPEAHHTTAGVKQISVSDKIGQPYRGPISAFQQYVCVKITDDAFEIWGPDNGIAGYLFGTIRTHDGSFTLLTSRPSRHRPTPLEVGESSVETEPRESNGAYVILRTDLGDHRHYLGQSFLAIDGLRLTGHTLLHIYQTVCALEKFSIEELSPFYEGSNIVFTLRRVPKGWVLTDDAEMRYQNYVACNPEIQNLFRNVVATDTRLLAEMSDGYYGLLVGQGSEACFAISFTYLCMKLFEESYWCFFSVLNELVESKANLFRSAKGVVAGEAVSFMKGYIPQNGFKIKGHGVLVSFAGLIKRHHISKTQVRDGNLPDGLYVLGYDPSQHSKQEGPDHYVVVKAVSGKLFLHLDPLGYDVTANREITQIALAGDYSLSYLTFEVDANGAD